MMTYALLILFPALMAYAAASDLVTMTIPNKVSLALIVSFLVVALLAGMPAERIGLHLAAGAAVLLVTFTLFAFGLIGGGDAKLAAATALWMGLAQTPSYLLVATLMGGVLTLAMLVARHYPWPSMLEAHPWIARLYRLDKGIPYGIALGFAGLVTYPSTEIWQRATG